MHGGHFVFLDNASASHVAVLNNRRKFLDGILVPNIRYVQYGRRIQTFVYIHI